MDGDLRVALSALDVAPVWTDWAATRALRDTIALAGRVEELGHRRFWVAEHRNGLRLATSVLVGAAAENRPPMVLLGSSADSARLAGTRPVEMAR